MKTILLMDIVITFFGVYLAFSALKMKRTGKITSLVVPEEEIRKCKDEKGYINVIVPYMFFFSVVAIIAGAIGILCYVKVIHVGRIWTLIELALFLLALFFFAYGMRRAKDQFF